MKYLQKTRLLARKTVASLARRLSASAYACTLSRLALLPESDVSVHVLSPRDRMDASWMSYASF